MSLYAVAELKNRAQIEQFLMQDADYAAYALGDLDPSYSDHAQWIGAARRGQIEALALIYNGIEPTALFLMGTSSAISALLIHHVGPEIVTLLAPATCLDLLGTFYQIENFAHMDRMRIDSENFQPYVLPVALPTKHLTSADVQAMLNLILQAAKHDLRDLRDIAFEPDMVEKGTYLGIFVDDSLVAMAGTHIEAPDISIAAVGNVVVHPTKRGHGLGKAISTAVTKILLSSGYERIVLNVRSDNVAAVQTYRRLGYRRVSGFMEAIGHRK